RRSPSAVPPPRSLGALLFFLTAPAATEIYPLSLHDALPIFHGVDPECLGLAALGAADHQAGAGLVVDQGRADPRTGAVDGVPHRSEEHTSELQSRENLVCRLLLEKKKEGRSGEDPRLARCGG